MKSAADHRLRGLFVPHMTPLDQAGELDLDTLRRYVQWLADAGVHGLYPNGSMGEFTRFTSAERHEITRTVAEAAAGRLEILAGAAEATHREIVETCRRYDALGLRTVAVVTPYYFRIGADAVYEFYSRIAEAIPNDLTLYNIPAFASPIDVATVVRLAENHGNIVGIKDSSGDLPHMMRMIREVRPVRPDFRFFTGWDASLTPMLLAGCDGGVNATSGVLPELTLAIYQAANRGDWETAMRWQYRLLPIFDAMLGAGEFPEGFRQAAAVRGWDFGRSRLAVGSEAGQKAAEARAKLEPLIEAALGDLKQLAAPA